MGEVLVEAYGRDAGRVVVVGPEGGGHVGIGQGCQQSRQGLRVHAHVGVEEDQQRAPGGGRAAVAGGARALRRIGAEHRTAVALGHGAGVVPRSVVAHEDLGRRR
jgi:hypothetical protein